MTLSAFLRDYLYIPLGGNRFGATRRYANLLTTMLLGGLWHGANWTFVLWGGLHGLYLVMNHGWYALRSRLRLPRVPGGAMLAGALTFVAVVVAWVPFRADSFATVMRMLKGMAGVNGVSLPAGLGSSLSSLAAYGVRFSGVTTITGLPALELMIWIALGLGIVWGLPNTQQWLAASNSTNEVHSLRTARYPLHGRAILTGVSLVISILGIARTSQFLYFQF